MKTSFFYSAIAALFLSVSSVSQAKQSFTLSQSKPEIQHIDIGTAGMSLGDILVFEADFTSKDGRIGGKAYGTVTLVSPPTGEKDPFLDMISNIVFDFGGTDSIVMNGRAVYPVYLGEIKYNTPQVRAITGGTGKFIGARGQLTTTRKPSGDYEHFFELLD